MVVKIVEGSTGFLPGSITINDDEVQINEVHEKAEVFDKSSGDFSQLKPPEQPAIQNAWNEFADGFKDTHPELKSLLMLLSPTVSIAHEFQIEVKNLLQKDKIEGLQAVMIPFMRKKLSNKFLSLKVTVNATKEEISKPVSPVEKLKYLSEKNSYLLDLQKKFGLEPEY